MVPDSGSLVELIITETCIRVYVMYTRRSLPFQFWLGRGRPLNPYLSGLIIDFLRKEMKPQQLSLIPDQMFAAGPVKDFLEWTTLRGWMKQWLQYCKWYYGTALSPEVTIQDFFDSCKPKMVAIKNWFVSVYCGKFMIWWVKEVWISKYQSWNLT